MIHSLILLGSTGSIGQQTLDLCLSYGIEVLGLSCASSQEKLKAQVLRYQPRFVAIESESAALEFSAWAKIAAPSLEIFSGPGASETLAAQPADMVLNAITGMAGLLPSAAAIRAGTNLALANKESIVAGGTLLMKEAKEKQVPIIPVDSEHSAILQCLLGRNAACDRPEKNWKETWYERLKAGERVERIFLTCSGGPFRTLPKDELNKQTAEAALKHPTWQMGPKITIDSSTLMNKGLEVIEAVRLFELAPEQVEVVIHPESIVHSGILFRDGASLCQLGTPDMKIPIGYALAYPERIQGSDDVFSFFSPKTATLHFEAPDLERFPCLKLAFEALSRGPLGTLVLNAANECLVEAFLKGKIRFGDFPEKIQDSLDRFSKELRRERISYNEMVALDGEVRKALERTL